MVFIPGILGFGSFYISYLKLCPCENVSRWEMGCGRMILLLAMTEQ